ncbi:hypothetical protein [Ectobacillus panaciterrae]|uniref:hypothetical protein n=1 Tax=Ectobacillus panaciterrae TaxID=363872 RepID=UPI00040B8486|nr:hypothetical protein [Ectobacillus panaciterrae]
MNEKKFDHGDSDSNGNITLTIISIVFTLVFIGGMYSYTSSILSSASDITPGSEA